MKGPVAAAIIAACGVPETVPLTLLITTDEETAKQGAVSSPSSRIGADGAAERDFGGRADGVASRAGSSQQYRVHLRAGGRSGAQR